MIITSFFGFIQINLKKIKHRRLCNRNRAKSIAASINIISSCQFWRDMVIVGGLRYFAFLFFFFLLVFNFINDYV